MACSACKSTGSGFVVNRSQGADNRPRSGSTVAQLWRSKLPAIVAKHSPVDANPRHRLVAKEIADEMATVGRKESSAPVRADASIWRDASFSLRCADDSFCCPSSSGPANAARWWSS